MAHGNYSLVLKADNTAWAWGDNFYGFLGDSTVDPKSSPVMVIGTYIFP